MARKLRLEYPEAIYHLMNRGDRRETLSCLCLFSAAWRQDAASSTSALATPCFEQLQLRFLEKVVVLQNPDDLEQVGFLVVAVDFDLVDQVRQHRVERNHRFHPFALQHPDALVS